LLDEKTVPCGASIIIPIKGGLFVSLSPVGGERQRVRGETKEDFRKKRNIPLTSVLSPGERGIKGEGEIQDKTNKTDSHQGCPYAGD